MGNINRSSRIGKKMEQRTHQRKCSSININRSTIISIKTSTGTSANSRNTVGLSHIEMISINTMKLHYKQATHFSGLSYKLSNFVCFSNAAQLGMMSKIEPSFQECL